MTWGMSLSLRDKEAKDKTGGPTAVNGDDPFRV
jgi:hypothetical protein